MRVCDSVRTQFVVERFGPPGVFGPAVPPSTCQPRTSVMHCHILSHEDEGCMFEVQLTCPGANNTCRPQRCPLNYDEFNYNNLPLSSADGGDVCGHSSKDVGIAFLLSISAGGWVLLSLSRPHAAVLSRSHATAVVQATLYCIVLQPL